MIYKLLLALVPLSTVLYAPGQTMLLYPAKIPNSRPVPNEETSKQEGNITIVSKITVPTLTAYPAPKSKTNGAAVIIFPGGGYWINAISHEGHDVAKKLNDWGYTAFVVKYRIPNSLAMEDPSIGPLQDAQQAILQVRSHANNWGVDASKIGIMGFSAGGHLASTLGTQYSKSLIENPSNVSLRPDFMILVYPVISSDSAISHPGSFEQLLGKNADASKLKEYSSEMQVNDQTPPTFLVHASDDRVVSPANSIVFYEALIKNKVPAELHIYQAGGHGFGMNNPTTKDKWMDRLKSWLETTVK